MTSTWRPWVGCCTSRRRRRDLARYWDSPLLTEEVRRQVVAAVTNVTLFYSQPGGASLLETG